MNLRNVRRIYLDHASATPIHPVAQRTIAQFSARYANPGALHAEAVEAKHALERARERIAAHLGSKAREIIFTSGLTEGNALAIVGAARALERTRRTLQGTHWLTSDIEHSSVLESFAEVERMGGRVTHIPPDKHGRIQPERVASLLSQETVFVSVGWANNELGVVQPLSRIARVLRAYEKKHAAGRPRSAMPRIQLHSDAGQGPIYLSPNVHTLGVDLFSVGSGKLYGPRGVGCLYVGTKATIAPIHFGGGQQRGLRPGTEDPILAAGFMSAFDQIARSRAAESHRAAKLRDELAKQIGVLYPQAVLNGDLQRSLPHMLNVSFPGEQTGEYLALRFDRLGVALSTKSTCREGEAASHVVEALEKAASTTSVKLSVGAPAGAATTASTFRPWRAQNTLRFSLGPTTTAADLKYVVAALQRIIPTVPTPKR